MPVFAALLNKDQSREKSCGMAGRIDTLLKYMSSEPADITIYEPDTEICSAMEEAVKRHNLPVTCKFVEKRPGGPGDKGGADAYIDLSQYRRIGAVLDRLIYLAERSREANIYFGPYNLDPFTKTLLRPGADPLRLTDKECDILVMLAMAGDEGVQRETLLEAVWGYKQALETHTLETHIYRLRQKIEEDAGQPQYLKTIENGYRLEGLQGR